VLRGEGVTLKSVFQNNGRLFDEVETYFTKANYKTYLSVDEEHGLRKLDIKAASGKNVTLNWDFVSHFEFQRATELYMKLEDTLKAPFVVTQNDNEESVNTRDELLEKVLGVAKKDLAIQRYKGLGEMNPEQLWETTMNPEKRTLLQVKVDDAVETDQVFTVLMGDAVEPRRKFIEDNALDVKNLDV
jgi:DNA gyrase subunit B